MKTKSLSKHLLMLGLSCIVVACGGGGGGGSEPASNAPIATPPSTPVGDTGTLQTAAGTPTYAAGSGELAAFDYLQSVRTKCGFGALNQSAKLDAASLAHSNYLLVGSSANNAVVGHFETDATNASFTGNSPQDRGAAAGYGADVAEILSAMVTFLPTADVASLPSEAAAGLTAMRSLVNTVGHLSDAMRGARSLGVGDNTRSFAATTGGVAMTTVHYRFGALLGSQEGVQLLGAGNVASYPCAEIQDAEYAFAPATEDPNPFPSITDSAIKVGPPIYLRADAGAVLKVDSYSLKTASAADVVVRTDVGAIGGHEFFMVPSSPLLPNSSYTVNLKGSANGKAFDKSFTLKTKS